MGRLRILVGILDVRIDGGSMCSVLVMAVLGWLEVEGSRSGGNDCL